LTAAAVITFTMRHLVFALLIALLPLRGWVGDAMALALPIAHGNGAAVLMDHHTAAGDAPHHAAAAHHTADGRTPPVPACGSHTATDTDGHGTCSACDVCNGPALVWTPAVAATPTWPHSRVALASARFASCEPKQGIKPPIS
jgi:hypothetical protein